MSNAMSTPAENKALVTRFWADLARRDFDAVGAYFAPDGHYIIVRVHFARGDHTP